MTSAPHLLQDPDTRVHSCQGGLEHLTGCLEAHRAGEATAEEPPSWHSSSTKGPSKCKTAGAKALCIARSTWHRCCIVGGFKMLAKEGLLCVPELNTRRHAGLGSTLCAVCRTGPMCVGDPRLQQPSSEAPPP
jgi:hypothetical protein